YNRMLADLREEEVQLEIAVNLLAPLWLTRLALPSLRSNKGSIVNFSSIRVVSPRKSTLIYSCIKSAVEKATEVLAGSLLEDGIRVNALRIGVVPGNHFLRATAQQMSPERAVRMVQEIMPRHFARSRET